MPTHPEEINGLRIALPTYQDPKTIINIIFHQDYNKYYCSDGPSRGRDRWIRARWLTLESCPLLASPSPKAYAYLGYPGLGYQASMSSS